jgi:3-oxoacyl-[acyl-carrier protein] reductase
MDLGLRGSRAFALNAGHAAELIRAGLPHLRANGRGAVVIVSSITGLRPGLWSDWPLV